MKRLMKKNIVKSNILIFQLCIMIAAGVVFGGSCVKAEETGSENAVEGTLPDNPGEELTLDKIYEQNGFLTEKDLEQAEFAFEKDNYHIIDNDTITVNVNSNIPQAVSRIEYNYGNGMADVMGYDYEKKTVNIFGNYAGQTQVSMFMHVTYCDEEGRYAGEKKIVATTSVEVVAVGDIQLTEGDSHELKYTTYPEYADFQYTFGYGSVATVKDGKLIALEQGSTVLYLESVNKEKKIFLGNVTIYPNGICFESESVNRAVASMPYQLVLRNVEGKNVVWKSSDENIARVSSTGVVTPVAQGKATISAEVVFSESNKEVFICEFNVTNPTIDVETKSNLAKGYEFTVNVTGTTSRGVWKSSNEKAVSVYADEAYTLNTATGIYTYYEKATVKGNKKGSAVITLEIDGIVRSFTVNVTNPKIKKDFFLLTKGMRQYIKITGTNSDSVVKYTSENTKVATVNSKGLVKAKKMGYSPIYIEVDRALFVVDVNIGKKKAIKAVFNALKAEGAIYSQAKRMQKGYYDCSSLVWRSYKPAGATFGQRYYAPVAATEAYYCVQKKKTIPKKNIYKLNKLRPGDLMFYKRDVNNGRYKNIYHVVIYMGQSTEIYGDYKYTYGRIIHANGSSVAQGGLYNHENCVVIGRPFK